MYAVFVISTPLLIFIFVPIADSRDKSVRESSGRERDWKKDRTCAFPLQFPLFHTNGYSASSRETTMPVIKNRLFNPDSKGTPSKKSRVVDPLFTNAKFSSPPIMPGLLSCLTQLLGRTSKPTPIQTLSIKNFLETPLPPGWSQHLLASETGSGKSVAYMLPLLQSLKQSELDTNRPPLSTQREYNPRAIVLAPTHELSRQLASFAKALLHEIKLRVVCASKTNVKNNRAEIARSASHMKSMMNDMETLSTGEMVIGQSKSRHPVDVMVGTPMKLLEMVRGRGWDRRPQEEEKEEKSEEAEDEDEAKPRRGRDMNPGYGEGGAKHEMGLKNVEWVVVDEADVLFDPDFQATTRLLLSDISAARGQPVPYSPEPSNLEITDVEPHNYPFNLVLTTATVPTNLDKYLHKHHPQLVRLMSPNLHHFPPTLMTEYASWTGGNKLADIEKRLRQVWSEDAKAFGDDGLSKVLIFCNQSTKVEALGHYFKDKGIPNIAMTSQSELRRRGSNKHLDGFLKAIPHLSKPAEQSAPGPDGEPPTRVMITTSLLSRGLDFTPDIRHVFIIDEPRNVIDFLHRAGRAARAGERGKVVIFGKIEGRGSDRMRVVRKRVVDLLA